MRTERRMEDDDVLILYTIAALSHHEAAAAAERLLRELGSEARPLLAATAQGHPDKRVQARARSLIAHRRR
jgi:plasmid stabilization system protein ParE